MIDLFLTLLIFPFVLALVASLVAIGFVFLSVLCVVLLMWVWSKMGV